MDGRMTTKALGGAAADVLVTVLDGSRSWEGIYSNGFVHFVESRDHCELGVFGVAEMDENRLAKYAVEQLGLLRHVAVPVRRVERLQ